MILTQNKQFTITAITGEGSSEIVTNNSLLKQLIVTATTSSTTFDIIITDEDSNELFREEDFTGLCNETAVNVPSYGNMILLIENASVDEAFDCNLTFQRS